MSKGFREETSVNALALLRETLEGSRKAEAKLFAYFAPIIRKAVIRTLFLSGVRARLGENGSLSVADCEQQVCIVFLERNKATLRNFRETEESEGLNGYVYTIARRTTRKIIQQRRTGLSELPTAPEAMPEPAEETPDMERAYLSRDLLDRMLVRLEDEMTMESKELFTLHFLDDLDGPEICARTGMSKERFWQWACRLRKTCSSLAAKMDGSRRSA